MIDEDLSFPSLLLKESHVKATGIVFTRNESLTDPFLATTSSLTMTVPEQENQDDGQKPMTNSQPNQRLFN